VRISLLVLLFGCASCIRPVTPTLVPFGGRTSAPSPVTVCQAVRGISDLDSFTFWVASTSGPGGDTTSAYIAPWDNGVGATINSVNVVLPLNSAGYSPVTAEYIHLVDLNPLSTYVICLTLPSTSAYEVFTEFADEGAGGLIKAIGSKWRSGYDENVVFSLAFESVLTVDPDYNYATSHEPTGWNCLVNTTFSCLQVNWQTLQVNTGYTGCASSEVLYGDPYSCSFVHAVYGSAAACWDAQYQHAWSYSNCDITGTRFYFNDTWVVGAGFLADGFANFAHNDQSVSIAGSGDCGFTYLHDSGSPDIGGFFLQLAELYKC